MTPPSTGPSDPSDTQGPDASPRFAAELTGDLPCIGCRYNLRGLSVRSTCPECGLPVRATILAVVDPYATELVPLPRPMLTAIALSMWSFGALAAALLLWMATAIRLLTVLGPLENIANLVVDLARPAILVSAVGALGLVRPHTETRRVVSLLALLGVVCYVPVLMAYQRIYGEVDSVLGFPYMSAAGLDYERSVLRLMWGAGVIAILLCLRPSARSIAARSVLVRRGRVDRQTLLATVAAVAVGMGGDTLHLCATQVAGDTGQVLRLVGTMLVATGAMLVTLALASIAFDTVRLWPVIRRHPVSIEDLVSLRKDIRGMDDKES